MDPEDLDRKHQEIHLSPEANAWRWQCSQRAHEAMKEELDDILAEVAADE